MKTTYYIFNKDKDLYKHNGLIWVGYLRTNDNKSWELYLYKDTPIITIKGLSSVKQIIRSRLKNPVIMQKVVVKIAEEESEPILVV